MGCHEKAPVQCPCSRWLHAMVLHGRCCWHLLCQNVIMTRQHLWHLLHAVTYWKLIPASQIDRFLTYNPTCHEHVTHTNSLISCPQEIVIRRCICRYLCNSIQWYCPLCYTGSSAHDSSQAPRHPHLCQYTTFSGRNQRLLHQRKRRGKYLGTWQQRQNRWSLTSSSTWSNVKFQHQRPVNIWSAP